MKATALRSEANLKSKAFHFSVIMNALTKDREIRFRFICGANVT